MNIDEFRTFIKAVAGHDKRTTDRDDLERWADAAQEDRWTFPTAMRALKIFRHENPDKWLNPGHISGIIRDARRKAAETFIVPKEPDDIKNADLPKWHRAQLAAHQDRLLAVWCESGDLPVTPIAAGQITGRTAQLTSGIDLTRCPEELKEQVAQDIHRAGRPNRRRTAVPLPRAVADDPARREHARAELEAARQKWGEPE